MENFKNQLLTILEDMCKDSGTKIFTPKIIKHNDVSLTAICLTPADSTIGTNYYLEDLFRQYEAGSTLMEIATNILNHNKNNSLLTDTSIIGPFISHLSSYDYIKNHLSIRLLNFNNNRKYLADKVFKPFLELNDTFEFALSLCLHIPESTEEHGIIAVTHQLRKMWSDVTDEELFETALINTESYCGCKISSMLEVLTNLTKEADVKESDVLDAINNISSEPTMFVMTNNISLHGATTILYRTKLKSFANEKECDFYVIPSSIHEIILIPDDGNVDTKEIEKIIAEVNRTAVSKSEFLSNQLLYYSRSDDTISIFKTHTRD